MRSSFFILTIAVLSMAGCKKTTEDSPPPQPPPPTEELIRLKDIVVKGMPAPYYHFEYSDQGLVTRSSFASGAGLYQIHYTSKVVNEVESIHPFNKDRLFYDYTAGKLSLIRYTDENGNLYRRAFLSYNAAGKLEKIEWERRQGNAGFIIDREVTLSYYDDGNLSELKDHRKPIDGQQQEAMIIDRFFDYDDRKNVDDFSWIHKDSEHLALLPGLKIQKNNPRKNVRSGDGLHYEITYIYTYDDLLPTRRIGEALVTDGPNAGKKFFTETHYSYYP